MSDYTEYIVKSIENGKTSLGPTNYLSDEAIELLKNIVVSQIEKYGKYDDSEKLFRLITKVSKFETKVSEYVEKECSNWIIKLFDIPASTISIEMNLVQTIDNTNVRISPEDTKLSTEISHDLIMKEISKRRILLSLAAGAASVLSSKIKWLEVFSKTSSKLPKVYKEIIKLRLGHVYSQCKKYKLADSSTSSVFIGTDDAKPEIVCDATCAPLLIEMAIRGLMELAISVGLPKNREVAGAVISKCDFSLAEKWDLMIGIPLWKMISDKIKSCGYSMREVGYNFFLMELSKMKAEKLFSFIDNLLINGDESYNEIKKICVVILNMKELDDFNDYVEMANNKFPLNDEYKTSDGLRLESQL